MVCHSTVIGLEECGDTTSWNFGAPLTLNGNTLILLKGCPVISGGHHPCVFQKFWDLRVGIPIYRYAREDGGMVRLHMNVEDCVTYAVMLHGTGTVRERVSGAVFRQPLP